MGDSDTFQGIHFLSDSLEGGEYSIETHGLFFYCECIILLLLLHRFMNVFHKNIGCLV